MPFANIIEQSDPSLTWVGKSPGWQNGMNQQNVWEVPGRDARYFAVRRVAYGNDAGSFDTYCAMYKTTDDFSGGVPNPFPTFSVLDFANAPFINTDGDFILTDKRPGDNIVSLAGFVNFGGGGGGPVSLSTFDLSAEVYTSNIALTGGLELESFSNGNYIKIVRLNDGTHALIWQYYRTSLDGTVLDPSGQSYNTLFVSHISAGGAIDTAGRQIIDQVPNPNPATFSSSFIYFASSCLDSRERLHLSYDLSDFEAGTCDVRYNSVQYNGGGSFTIGTPVSFVKIQSTSPPLLVSEDANGNLRGLFNAATDQAFLPNLFGIPTSGFTVLSGSWPQNISMIRVDHATTSPSPVFEGVSNTTAEPLLDVPGDTMLDGVTVWPAVWINGTCLYYACQCQGRGVGPTGGNPPTRTRIWTRNVNGGPTWQTPGIDWWIWTTNAPNPGPNFDPQCAQDGTFPDMQIAPIRGGTALANVWSFDTFKAGSGGLEVGVCLYYFNGASPQSCSPVRRLSAPEKIVRRGAMGFRI